MDNSFERTSSDTRAWLKGGEKQVSRRIFLLAMAGLVAGCSTSTPVTSSSSVVSSPVVSPSAQPDLTRALPISQANAAQVVKMAVLKPGKGYIRGLSWLPGNRMLAVGTWEEVQIWDILSLTRKAVLTGIKEQAYMIACSPDGKLLAASVGDNTLFVWDIEDQKVLHNFQGTGISIYSVAWSPDGKRLAAGNHDGTVQIWNSSTWGKPQAWGGPAAGENPVKGHNPLAAWTIAWSPDGKHLAAVRYNRELRVWDASSGKLLRTLETSSNPNGVSWSPDGQTLASASDDGTIQLWNPVTYKNTRTLEAETEAGWAFAIPWSPDGRLMACTRDRHIVQIWDVQAAQQLKVLDGHADSIWTAVWSKDARFIASGSDDGTVCLWGVV